MLNKIKISLLSILCFTLAICSVSYADSKKEKKEEDKKNKQGYVQLDAYVTKDLEKYNPSVKVIISDGTDTGEVITTYLTPGNKYRNIVTLDEGFYMIEHAEVVGDENGDYPFNISESAFKIIKNKPARMYFSLGIVDEKLPPQRNNMEETEEEDKDTPSPSPELDIYDKEGNIDEKKVEDLYKEVTGETIEDTIDNDTKAGRNEGRMKEEEEGKEGEEKEEQRKRDVLENIVYLILFAALIGLCIYDKLPKKKKNR